MITLPDVKKHFITWTTVLFIVEIITMQFVYSSFDFLATPLSMYGTGKYGFIICSGLALIGINYLLLCHDYFRMNGGRMLRIGTWILVVAGISVLFVALLQTDTGQIVTLRGKIHVVAAHIHFIVLPYATLLIALGIRSAKKDMVYVRVTIVFSGVNFLGGIVLLLKDVLHVAQVDGMIQKVWIVLILCWIIYSAQAICSLERKTSV